MKKLILSMIVATGLGAAVWAGIASGEQTCAVLGNSTFCGEGKFSPKKLPKKEMAPISLKTNGSVTTDDGTVPPVVQTVQIDFDDDGDITTKGIPTCDRKKLINTSTEDAKKECGPAIVGTGRVNAIIELEDQDPIPASGPLLIFNGEPRGKKPTVVFHTLIDYPLPTAYVTEAVVKKSKKGKDYGKGIFIKVPPIAGGQGTLVSFDAKVKKLIKVKSKSKSKKGKRKTKTKKRKYLLARCANKRLIADAELTLEDGRKLGIGFVEPCKQKKAKKKRGKAQNRKGKTGKKGGKNRR